MIIEKQNNLNIKELIISIQESKSIAIFDPKRDLSADDWRLLHSKLESEKPYRANFLESAVKLYTLFPEKKSELGLSDNPDEYASFAHPSRIAQLAQCKLLFPEYITREYIEDINNSRVSFESLYTGIDQIVKGEGDFIYLNQDILSGYILFPNKIKKLNKITGSKEFLEDKLKGARNNISIEETAEILVNLKLLYPNKINTYLTENDWKLFHQTLSHYKNTRNSRGTLNLSFHMLLLAADQMSMSDNRLQVTLPVKKNYLMSTEPPIIRKF
jgi:hypothetical protein